MRGRDAGAAVRNEVREVPGGESVMQGLVDHCNNWLFSEGNGDPLQE